MKFKRYFSLGSIFFMLSAAVSAQSVVKGKLTDANNESLTGAVVELRFVKDSTLARVNVSDGQGRFVLDNIKAGDYYLKASLLGFTPHKSEAFSVDGASEIEFPVIRMEASAVTLKEASITGIKPLIEVRADKTVFNVESSINAVGSTAYELLQKSPGVVVDNNDNILLKGRGGVLVQFDGRNSNLSQQELGDYLKSIQSTDVESIELISNPSSKYDAEGSAGIINIKLKKNKNYGSNGNITLGYALGEYSKYNTGISLNSRSKKFSFYSNYSNNWGKRRNEFFLYREQKPYTFDATSVFERWGLNQNYKAGADYSMNSRNTIGIMVTGNYSDINGTTHSSNNIGHFGSDAPDSILTSNQTIDGHVNAINGNLNHHYSDTLGNDLATDLDIGY